MATAQKHLDDLKWLFMEKGLQHVYDFLQLLFTTPTSLGITAPATVGSIEVDGTTNFAAGLRNTINPSGQLDLIHSTTLEYGAGAVSKHPPTNTV